MAFQLPVGIQTHSMTSPGTTIYYPQIVGLQNRSVQEHINRTIINLVTILKQEQLRVQTGTNMQMTGHYEIKTNERGILSLILTNYAYSQPMAHGNTIAKSLTFDVNTGKLYSLSDLFKPGSDYVAALSSQISVQLKQRDLPLLNSFTAIKPNQDFYLADKSIVIYFQLYEITPYYVGFPMFPISIYSVQDIIAEGGPLDLLSADVA
ncbi:hypothetical protein Back11_13190 [Paenibacillus baekrokdamisoli]|uniref:DUF3298 domain-containing protein n=1 Tax=Paenibacillus baekrokdamisoli TaxID=1712516 RepID=A0A3G9J9J7_9BACL|nr:DUF3298 and DUF4163 domain-containing protein [Paenibacillus baekrokdamisoli]MBB3070623.1 hypothetical protein [Paenibacillus baekrokdamisoli]BBH19974.1 hypothetical protein Back11_13190 [Paenibacillus baekrokdamisoli]